MSLVVHQYATITTHYDDWLTTSACLFDTEPRRSGFVRSADRTTIALPKKYGKPSRVSVYAAPPVRERVDATVEAIKSGLQSRLSEIRMRRVR